VGSPARDFRLLIAIDVVRGFPDHVVRRAAHYAMPNGKSVAEVKSELQRVLASELASLHTQMAYNPNDCVEVRWGAPENSEEASTCKRHAP
jgi:hypothetical protein